MLFQLFGPVLFSAHVYGSFAATDASSLTLYVPPFLHDNMKETFYTFKLFLFDAFRVSQVSTWSSWIPITYDNVRKSSSNSGAMDIGTGMFTVPLAGTYQFIIQVYKVSHFLLLTHNLTILLFTYICMCIIICIYIIYVK